MRIAKYIKRKTFAQRFSVVNTAFIDISERFQTKEISTSTKETAN